MPRLGPNPRLSRCPHCSTATHAFEPLRGQGGDKDYASLFHTWDTDRSGALQYTESLGALSGQRYDAFATGAPPPPPLPPLLICTPAEPFVWVPPQGLEPWSPNAPLKDL